MNQTHNSTYAGQERNPAGMARPKQSNVKRITGLAPRQSLKKDVPIKGAVYDFPKSKLPKKHPLRKVGEGPDVRVFVNGVFADDKVVHMQLHADETTEPLVNDKTVSEFNRTQGKVNVNYSMMNPDVFKTVGAPPVPASPSPYVAPPVVPPAGGWPWEKEAAAESLKLKSRVTAVDDPDMKPPSPEPSPPQAGPSPVPHNADPDMQVPSPESKAAGMPPPSPVGPPPGWAGPSPGLARTKSVGPAGARERLSAKMDGSAEPCQSKLRRTDSSAVSP